jgi:glycosyltransferase involved in cell wall biosynthesis
MRVGVDCTIAARPRTGFETYTVSLARALVELRSEVEFVLFLPRRMPPQLASLKDSFVAVTSPFNNHVFANQVWLTAALSGTRVDVMHYPAFPPLLPPRRFVLTVHDCTPWMFSDTMQTKSHLYFRSSLRLWGKRSRLIITPSEASKTDIVRCLGIPAGRVKVVALGVGDGWTDSSSLDAPLPVDGLASVERDYILFVGTVEPRKNLAVVIRALARLRKRGLHRHLVIVGRWGWGVAALQQIVQQYGLADTVHFAGHVSDDRLKDFYRRAAVLVQPSMHEGFGLPIVEAMALGCPVIASRIPAHLAVLADAGLYFTAADDAELAEVMSRVISTEQLRGALTESGLRRSRHFTWQEAAARTLELYREVARGQGA